MLVNESYFQVYICHFFIFFLIYMILCYDFIQRYISHLQFSSCIVLYYMNVLCFKRGPTLKIVRIFEAEASPTIY